MPTSQFTGGLCFDKKTTTQKWLKAIELQTSHDTQSVGARLAGRNVIKMNVACWDFNPSKFTFS